MVACVGSRTEQRQHGAVAQSVERMVETHEVGGSIPPGPTRTSSPTRTCPSSLRSCPCSTTGQCAGLRNRRFQVRVLTRVLTPPYLSWPEGPPCKRIVVGSSPTGGSGSTAPATGCGLVGKAPALGAGDREFESRHPDAYAPLTQLAEWRTFNPTVPGSSPGRGTSLTRPRPERSPAPLAQR